MQQPYPLDPEATAKLEWPWGTWLEGASINSYDVVVPAGITRVSMTQTGTTISALVRLTSPGSAAGVQRIKCRVTASDGRIGIFSIWVDIREL